MSKNAKLAINGAVALVLLGALIWFAWGKKTEGVKCQYCGKSLAAEDEFGHESRCPENKANRQFDQTGK